MDFQQLMKQASANQSYTKKMHEQKKKQQEEKKRREEEERREKVRKASALLHGMKKATEKKEREYRGIVNSRAAEYEKATAKLSAASSSDCGTNRTTPSNGRPHPLATTSGKQTSGGNPSKKSDESSQTAKGKTKISPTQTSSSKSSAVTSTSKTPKTLSVSKSSGSTSGSKTPSSKPPGVTSSYKTTGGATSSKPTTMSSTVARGSGGPKAPVNFQQLMKLAEQKKSGHQSAESGVGKRGNVAASGPSRTDHIRTVEVGKCADKPSGGRSRSGSPLGKLLLEKSTSRGRGRNGLGRGGERGGGGEGGGTGEKNSVGVSQSGSRVGQKTGGGECSAMGNKLRELAQSRVVGRGGKAVREVGTSQKMPESALLMRERFRKELEASANGSKTAESAKTATKPSAKSNSFYASSHAELSKEGRPKFANKRATVSGPRHQSSWVSDMNEYVERLREGGGEGYSEEDEEDDGLDDFVVEDEGDDVSSAIREIFGYDRRRYGDDDDDDRMMESSFAQQQYEEMRSSRIGRQEDAEDIRRENERLSCKRRNRGGGGPSLSKQTKLSFR